MSISKLVLQSVSVACQVVIAVCFVILVKDKIAELLGMGSDPLFSDEM